MVAPSRLGFCRRRVDNPFYFGNTVCRKASLLGVFLHRRLIWGDIHAIDLVVGHIAFEPLDLRPELLEDAARLLRDTLQLVRRELSGSRNFAFDYVFWHISRK